jgi:hypothetical protein
MHRIKAFGTAGARSNGATSGCRWDAMDGKSRDPVAASQAATG